MLKCECKKIIRKIRSNEKSGGKENEEKMFKRVTDNDPDGRNF